MKNGIIFFVIIALAALLCFPPAAFAQTGGNFFENVNLNRGVPPADVLMIAGGVTWEVLNPILTSAGPGYMGWESNKEWWITFYWSNKTKADFDNLVSSLVQSGLPLASERSDNDAWRADFTTGLRGRHITLYRRDVERPRGIIPAGTLLFSFEEYL